MSSSALSGGVVGECAGWSAEAVVEADRGCEREEACSDAGAEAVEGAGAVAFQGQQVFAGLEDRLDSLPDRSEVRSAAGLVSAAGPQDGCVEVGGELFELAAGIALVAEHEQVAGALAALEQGEADVAFGRLGGGEHQGGGRGVRVEAGVEADAHRMRAE